MLFGRCSLLLLNFYGITLLSIISVRSYPNKNNAKTNVTENIGVVIGFPFGWYAEENEIDFICVFSLIALILFHLITAISSTSLWFHICHLNSQLKHHCILHLEYNRLFRIFGVIGVSTDRSPTCKFFFEKNKPNAEHFAKRWGFPVMNNTK